MSSVDMVRTPDDRQIRSYHRADRGELTLYTFGGDLRPWRPIPARGVFWAATIEACVFVLAHLAGLSLPFGSAGWGIFYLGLPIGLAWLFTVARIEGRRLHVALVAWVRHAVLGNHLAGGYQRLPSRSPRPLGPSRISVAASYEPPRPWINGRYVVASLPILVLLLTAWIAVSHRGTHARLAAATHPAVVRHPTVVHHPAARRKIAFRVPPPIRLHVRSVPKRAHTPPAARAVRRRTVRLTSTPRRRRTVPPVYRAAPARAPTPVVHAVAPTPRVVAPAPVVRAPVVPVSHPTCYPGELGC